jgi:hypothetical protein
MIIYQVTRDDFMATANQSRPIPGQELHILLAAVATPIWHPGSEVPLDGHAGFASAMAMGLGGAPPAGLKNQILLDIDSDPPVVAGAYIGEAIAIDPAYRRRGLSTPLILRCVYHRDVPTHRTVSTAGKAALERAHEAAVRQPVADGCTVPAAVRQTYGL